MRTVLLSPEPMFGEAVSACLADNDGIDVVGLALDPATVREAVEVLRPTVLVCDQRSPGRSLSSLVASCRDAHDALRVVLLATVDAPSTEERTHYDAVVPPRSSIDRVVAAVREVAWRRSTAERPTSPRLTERELEVLRLLAAGHGTNAMAERLHLSPHTVRNHVRNLTGKLEVSSRLEAVTQARRLALV